GQGPKYRPDQIVFMGDSAGGNLCMASMLYLRDHLWGKVPMPAGLGLLCPWMDLTHSSPSYVFNGAHDYLPAGTRDTEHLDDDQTHYYIPNDTMLTNPLVSPMFSRELPDRPIPPTYIQVGGAERLRDENLITYAETFKNSNIKVDVFEEMVHVWQLFAVAESFSRHAVHCLADFAVEVTSLAGSNERALSMDIGRNSSESMGVPSIVNSQHSKPIASAPRVPFVRSCNLVKHSGKFPHVDFGDVDEFLKMERERLKEAHLEVLKRGDVVLQEEVVKKEEPVAVAVVAASS
ncbi:hypothetical protein HDU76_007021, partial [Blyttiomyces sp. JEL0837]